MTTLAITNALARFEVSGYAKSLDFVSPDSKGTGKTKGLSGSRLRLNGLWQDSSCRFDARILSDSEILIGSLLAQQRGAFSGTSSQNELLELNWDLNEKENVLWRQVLYRAYAETNFKNLDLTVGRQRIAWGQGRLWNPTDVINPYNPLSVEKEERPGSDLAHFRLAFSGLSFLEGVYVPKRSAEWRNALVLGRMRVNFQGMDFGFLGGKRAEERLAGLDFASQVAEGSLRSEASYAFDSKIRKDFARAVVSYDRSFNLPNTLYVLAEYLYNGIGERDKADYFKVLLDPADQKFLGKDYVGSGVTYEWTALWKTEVWGILNLNDASLFLGPKISWQPIADLDVALGVQLFTGRDRTEFGPIENIGFLQVQWFFNAVK